MWENYLKQRLTHPGAIFSLAVLIGVPAVADARVDGAMSPVVSSAASTAAARPDRALNLDWFGAEVPLGVVLPRLAEAEQSAVPASDNGPLQIGVHRGLPIKFRGDLAPRLKWIARHDGSIVSAVVVTSPGALEMRAAMLVDLPPGGEIRFFGGDANERLPVTTRANIHWLKDPDWRPATLWSPVVGGDSLGIEITLPSRRALAATSFRVEKISHAYASMSQPRQPLQDTQCPGHIDVQCRASELPSNIEDAVARIRVEAHGVTLSCAGTLLNDTDEEGFIPYFLTAHHCVPTAEAARTVVARWFYQQAACGGTAIDSRDQQTSGGAELLKTSSRQDSTLLKLQFDGPVPGGLWFSGWNNKSIGHPAGVFTIHHPAGSVKKYSAGMTLGQDDFQTGGVDGSFFTVANGIEVGWDEGLSEGGSSGSGLFNSNGNLIGALSSDTPEECGGPTLFGSFRDFFPLIRGYLDPSSLVSHEGDDHGNTLETATDLPFNGRLSGEIDPASDFDYFRLRVMVPRAVTLYSVGNLDVEAILFNADGIELARDSDTGEGKNFLIRHQLLPGEYFIEVRSYDEIAAGSYTIVSESSLTAVSIPDPTLRAALEAALGKAPGEAITSTEMEILIEVVVIPLSSRATDLSGLEFATNLLALHLGINSISDLTPLSGLTSLQWLFLGNNLISDLTPLAGLTNLTRLELHDNSISDLTPLAGMTSLTALDLENNNSISDLAPLAGMTSLRQLNLQNNSISDLTPLSVMTSLRRLFLADNLISGLTPLAGLTSLEELFLEDNLISNLTPLSGLTELQALYLLNNSISDLTPLSGLTELQALRLHNNSISDLTPLTGLTKLGDLRLEDNLISDLAPLVANVGFCCEAQIDLRHNPLGAESQGTHIPILQSRGVIVFFIDDHSESSDTATDLPLGETIGGELDPFYDIDYFRLRITAVTKVAIFTTGRMATIGTLFNEAGAELAHYDRSDIWRRHEGLIPRDQRHLANFLIEYQLAPGEYYVRVANGGPADPPLYRIAAEERDLVVMPLPDRRLGLGGDSLRLGLTRYFPSLSGTPSYTAVSSNPALVTVRVEAGALIIQSNAESEEGTVTITITATDSTGQGIIATIMVTLDETVDNAAVARGLLQGWRLPWLVEESRADSAQ